MGRTSKLGGAGRHQAGEQIGVTRRRDVRRVRRKGRELEEERLAHGGRPVDEMRAAAGDHVGEIVPRSVAEVVDRPVDVELVAELAIAPPGDVPLRPSGGHCRTGDGGAARALQIAVDVLAHHRRAVPGALESDVERAVLVAVVVERLEAAEGACVGEDARVVRELPGEDRGARRAAQRVGDEVVVERHPVGLQRLHLRHVRQQVHRQIVGEHEDDVGMARAGLEVGRLAGDAARPGPAASGSGRGRMGQRPSARARARARARAAVAARGQADEHPR